MKLSTSLVLALAVGVGAAGCSRKHPEEQIDRSPAEPPAPKPGEGSGSAAAKPPLKSGNELATLYTSCIANINQRKLAEFKDGCLAANYVGHEMDGESTPNPDAVIASLKEMQATFGDFRFEPQLVLV